MFGPLTRRRALHAGDHVLALAMPGEVIVCELNTDSVCAGIGACLPATVTSTLTAQVEVRFSDGERYAVINIQSDMHYKNTTHTGRPLVRSSASG